MAKITLAFIADLHLTETCGSPQHACFNWAMDKICEEKPDVIISLGDATLGSPEAAYYFKSAIQKTGIRVLSTLGNSDLRNPQSLEEIKSLLIMDHIYFRDEYLLLTLDSSSRLIHKIERERIEVQLNAAAGQNAVIVLMLHHPPENLEADSREWLLSLIEKENISFIVAGHTHKSFSYQIGKTQVFTIKGLDPDKALGGPPSLALLNLNDGHSNMSEISCKTADTDEWSVEDRAEFVDMLGISCMEYPLWGLEYAAAAEVKCVEVRFNALQVPKDELLCRLADWRAHGGTYLSFHMPSLLWDDITASVTNQEVWKESLELALEMGVQGLTVHVPGISAGLMVPGSNAWKSFSDVLYQSLAPAVSKGVIVGIENLHMNPGENADLSRGYGYLPEECLEWINELRSRLGDPAVGFHLDIGHARNNVPFSERLSLGQWYALMGREIVKYHLHQVEIEEDEMMNHQPIRNVYGPMISFSSFLWSWKTGLINRRPMILEITGDKEGIVLSLETLIKHMGRNRGLIYE